MPFCLTRCGYCDFNAYAGLDHLAPPYVGRSCARPTLAAPAWAGRRVRVASSWAAARRRRWTPADLAALLDAPARAVRRRRRRRGHVEANPDTVDAAYAARAARGRRRRACRWARSRSTPRCWRRSSGCTRRTSVRRAFARRPRGRATTNVNLDLIYGADGETLESWRTTLRARPSTLAPEHVSRLRADDRAGDAARPQGRARAPRRRPTPTCRPTCSRPPARCSAPPATSTTRSRTGRSPAASAVHNLGYWERRPYLGLGAGAHSLPRRPPLVERPPARAVPGARRARRAPGRRRGAARALRRLPRGGVPAPADLEGIPASWIEPERRRAVPRERAARSTRRRLVPTERGMLLLNELVLALTA